MTTRYRLQLKMKPAAKPALPDHTSRRNKHSLKSQ